jgi:hypothetical protein
LNRNHITKFKSRLLIDAGKHFVFWRAADVNKYVKQPTCGYRTQSVARQELAWQGSFVTVYIKLRPIIILDL